jgi:anti-anti-sigma factor
MASYAIEISTVADPSAVVLSVRGEIDLSVSADLLSTIVCAGSESEVPRVLVDLDAVTFMDSSGISALVHAHQQLADRGVVLQIVGGPAQIRTVLSITGVEDLLRGGTLVQRPGLTPA